MMSCHGTDYSTSNALAEVVALAFFLRLTYDKTFMALYGCVRQVWPSVWARALRSANIALVWARAPGAQTIDE